VKRGRPDTACPRCGDGRSRITHSYKIAALGAVHRRHVCGACKIPYHSREMVDCVVVQRDFYVYSPAMRASNKRRKVASLTRKLESLKSKLAATKQQLSDAEGAQHG
jgi:transcriptional regulator NrdR family protein